MKASAMLPENYAPQARDILSGRSKESFQHDGNREFRNIIAIYLPQYLSLTSRRQRGAIIISIMDLIQSKSGRFLEKKCNRWVCLTSKQARDKVGHALRDAAKEKKVNRAHSKMQELNQAKVKRSFQKCSLDAEMLPVADVVRSIPNLNHDFPAFNEVSECRNRTNQPSCTSADWTQFLDMLLDESTSTESEFKDDSGPLSYFEAGLGSIVSESDCSDDNHSLLDFDAGPQWDQSMSQDRQGYCFVDQNRV